MITRFRKKIGPVLEKIVKPIPKFISPNLLTILSIPFSLLFAYFITINDYGYALIFLALSALVDALDGALARLRGKVTKAGAFLDSSVDRFNDVIIFSTIYFLTSDLVVTAIWVIGSLLISFTRGLAELFGCKGEGVGVMERGERLLAFFGILLLIYVAGSLEIVSYYIYLAFYLFGALILITLAQRLFAFRDCGLTLWASLMLSSLFFALYPKMDLVGLISFAGFIVTLYMVVKARGLGLEAPLKFDAFLDPIALGSLMYSVLMLPWLTAAIRLIYYFKTLSSNEKNSSS